MLLRDGELIAELFCFFDRSSSYLHVGFRFCSSCKSVRIGCEVDGCILQSGSNTAAGVILVQEKLLYGVPYKTQNEVTCKKYHAVITSKTSWLPMPSTAIPFRSRNVLYNSYTL